MGRKGESISLSLKDFEKKALEELAKEYGMMWGDRPNISKLLKAIAQRKLLVAANHDWSSERIENLNRIRKLLVDLGKIEEAKLIAQILSDRSEINEPLRAEIEQFLAQPLPAWRQKIDSLINQQQPFKLIYQDARQELFQFTVLHAQVIQIEKREFLVCRCEESEGNTDVEELKHNWTLRLDRIQEAKASAIERRWERDLQKVLVELHLYRGLIFNYESKPDDVDPDKLDMQLTQTESDLPFKRIVREVYSTFWFFREIVRYGMECEIVSPENIRAKFVNDKVYGLSKVYNIESNL
ncbi:MAG: WYL domain-containing protein [Cyanobacteria bacterium P01_G01_bin.19]